jgi:hypothetical protein
MRSPRSTSPKHELAHTHATEVLRLALELRGPTEGEIVVLKGQRVPVTRELHSLAVREGPEAYLHIHRLVLGVLRRSHARNIESHTHVQACCRKKQARLGVSSGQGPTYQRDESPHQKIQNVNGYQVRLFRLSLQNVDGCSKMHTTMGAVPHRTQHAPAAHEGDNGIVSELLGRDPYPGDSPFLLSCNIRSCNNF